MKLNVRWRYNNVWIKEGDEHKAAFKMRRGLFELTVMFFRLTNSPAMFQAMMNSIYQQTITKHKSQGTNIRIYMDDITIATKNTLLTAHVDTVSDILQVVQDHSLFFKLSRCSFHVPSIDYLGLVLEKGLTKMDLVKVARIHDWPTPKTVKDVSWILQLLPLFHSGIFQDSDPPQCTDKEGGGVLMDGSHTEGLQNA
jgi:hypothetical protein